MNELTVYIVYTVYIVRCNEDRGAMLTSLKR